MTTNFTGAYPIDPTTPTGLFRQELGDVDGTPANPATDPQTAEYGFFSDASIAALIIAYPGATNLAMAKARQSMAQQMIIAAEDITVDDIKIATIAAATAMLNAATEILNSAANSDAATAFYTTPLVSKNTRQGWPQGTPRPFNEMSF